MKPLSSRENQIIHGIAHGLRNKEIAAILYLTENTVKTHIQRILAKYNVNSRTQAAMMYLQRLEENYTHDHFDVRDSAEEVAAACPVFGASGKVSEVQGGSGGRGGAWVGTGDVSQLRMGEG